MDRDLVRFFNSDKEFAQKPAWVQRDKHYFMLSSATLDIDGVTVQGLELRGNAQTAFPNEAISLQLQYTSPKGRSEHLCRICWKPCDRHNNRGLGPPEFREKFITTSHHHVFDLNYNPERRRMWRGDLKIAIPIDPEIETYEDLLDFVGKEFRIKNMQLLGPPKWQGQIL